MKYEGYISLWNMLLWGIIYEAVKLSSQTSVFRWEQLTNRLNRYHYKLIIFRKLIYSGWQLTKVKVTQKKPQFLGQGLQSQSNYTKSLTFFRGLIFIMLRAGLALKIVGSPVKGLIPLRAFVAGFLLTRIFIKPPREISPGPFK